MKKVALFSVLLAAGLAGSQALPFLPAGGRLAAEQVIGFLTMTGLSFIMIHVGYEFELEKDGLRSYGWDYVVAMTAAGFPWICAAAYFIFLMMPPELWSSGAAWKEVLIAGRFAAPTATGVLFAMLTAAGLGGTWMFRKTRLLVIFDDLDTVLLMIPLKILMVGLVWPLAAVVAVMAALLWAGWRWLHTLAIPASWPRVLVYSALIAGLSEAVYHGTKAIDLREPLHLEVLLPAFILGCMMRRPERTDRHEGPEPRTEQRVATIVSAAFMLLVGLSMPSLLPGASPADAGSVTASLAPIPPLSLAGHVVALTLLINAGKMFPAFCYRGEASWQHRLAVAVAMCPRGEVGAGIILLSLDYGIGGPIVSVAVLSLALNLVLTPFFLLVVARLVRGAPPTQGPSAA